MTEIWADVHSGKANIVDFNLTKYAKKYHVGKFKRSMIEPYIIQNTCPTYEQACELRKEISEYINDRPAPQTARQDVIEQNLFNININTTPNEDAILKCINYLKEQGYIVFKKV